MAWPQWVQQLLEIFIQENELENKTKNILFYWKTREDVKLQDHLVQTNQELKSTRKLLNQAMEIIKKQSEQSRQRRNQQRRRGKGKMDQPNTKQAYMAYKSRLNMKLKFID